MKRTASRQALKTALVLLSMTAAYGGLYLNQRVLLSDRRPSKPADPGTDMMVALGRAAEARLRERTISLDEERKRLLAMLASDPRRMDRAALERRIAELAAEQARAELELARSETQRAAAERIAAERTAAPNPLVLPVTIPLPAVPDNPALSEGLRIAEEDKEKLARELTAVSREAAQAKVRTEELTFALESERRAAKTALAREQATVARLSSDAERISSELAAMTNRANALTARVTAAELELNAVYSKAGINGVFFGAGTALRIGINPARSSEIYSRGAYNVYPPGDSTAEVRTKVFIYEENRTPAYRLFPGYPPPQKGDWF